MDGTNSHQTLPQKVKKEKTSHLVQQAIDLIKEEMK